MGGEAVAEAPELTMEPPPALDEPDDAVHSEGFTAAMKYIVCQFLEDRHYAQLHKALSKRWDREHSLSAAMKLMEQYGVTLTQQEVDRLSTMDEAKQIEVLVMKMPQQSNEQFQHFFLQLQLIVSTAQRVKQALTEGRPDLVEMALDDAESTGIAPYILKMAIVQAGTEVAALRQQYEAWIRETDAKMARVMRGQDDAMQAQKRLAAAQAQLSAYSTGANDKAKKVLMSLSSGNATALLTSTFKGWMTYIKQSKEEREICGEYEDRIELANKKLMEFKEKQLSGVRKVMMKKAQEGDQLLLQDVIKVFKSVVEDAKFDKENGDKIRALEEQLSSFKSSQAENTKRVMARMGASGDQDLVSTCLKAWINFRLEYLKDKEANDAVKAAEAKVNQFMKGHKENAKALLDKMSAGTNTGLMHEVMEAWVTLYVEDKKQRELEEILNSAESKFGEFGERNANNAKTVMERARLHLEEMVLRRHWNAWRLHARLEGTLAQYQAKIEAKKQQLYQVQQMFRSFAAQLEAGLREDVTDHKLAKKSQKSMNRSNEGSVSLPNIHSGRNTPKSSGRVTPTGPREAWAN
jgi:hypothetical protein